MINAAFNVPTKGIIKEKLENFKDSTKDFWQKVVDNVTQRKVYYYITGCDCDGTVYGYPVEYKNIKEANIHVNSMYYWADGPINCTRIKLADYLKAERYRRDTFAEKAGY